MFVESYRPGVMKRLGVDYETVSERNPRIVYCSISAFGQDGPYRDRPAHDLAIMALGGALSMSLGRDGVPAMSGVAVADIVSRCTRLSGVLMALLPARGDGPRRLHRRQHASRGARGDAERAGRGHVATSRSPIPSTSARRAARRSIRSTTQRTDAIWCSARRRSKFVRNLLERLGRPDLIALVRAAGRGRTSSR